MIYRYTRHVFKKGKLVQRETCEIDGPRVERESPCCRPGREAFLELINKWNRNGLLGPNQYLYVAVP